MKDRLDWIDILRGIAICAVVVDHGIFLFWETSYRQSIIWQHTYFSIIWFIFLSGVANALSAKRNKWVFPRSYLTFWMKRIAILAPYIYASIIVYLSMNTARIDPAQFLHSLLYFSLQPTFYFINLILQLYFIFPSLYHLVIKCKTVWHKTLFAAVMLVVTLQILKINPVGILAVPGFLFGGAYLFIFVLGILYAEINFKLNPLLLIISAILFARYEFILLFSQSGFSTNLSLAIWSVSLLIVVKTGLSRYFTNHFWAKILGYLGRHSIFIYLFHYLFLTLFKRMFIFPGPEIIIIMISSICLSLLAGYSYQFIKRRFCRYICLKTGSGVLFKHE